MHREHLRGRATGLLVLATLFWGISFPVMKAIGLTQQMLLPQSDTWFVAANTLVVRFGVAGVITLAWAWRTFRAVTWLELYQGLGLGFFGGLGMLFQMDGIAYTSASTSAFLTQSYCLFLPIVVSLRERKRPSPGILLCSVLVMIGVAILSQVGWRSLRLGRGEIETLISSVIFSGQILWLERPRFSRNRVRHFTPVMFLTMAAVPLPVALWTMQHPMDWLVAYRFVPVQILTGILVLFCTMIAFVLMNHWQPILPAAEAALIYAAEPVFASVFSLFLPVWLSHLAGVAYPNERLTGNLLLGGGLITIANVFVQVRALQLLKRTASGKLTALLAG